MDRHGIEQTSQCLTKGIVHQTLSSQDHGINLISSTKIVIGITLCALRHTPIEQHEAEGCDIYGHKDEMN